jgi:hypothetical protein
VHKLTQRNHRPNIGTGLSVMKQVSSTLISRLPLPL